MKYLTSFLQFLARITATFGKMTSFIAHSSPRNAMQCHIELSKNAKKLFERGWAKIEYVSINSNWTQEIMAGRKKKSRYSEETP